MSFKKFGKDFRSTVPGTTSNSRFRRNVDKNFESDLNELRRSTQDVNTMLDYSEHDNLNDQYKPQAIQSSPLGLETMEHKFLQTRQKKNLTKKKTLDDDLDNYRDSDKLKHSSVITELKNDQASSKLDESSEIEENKKFQDTNRMSHLLPKIREKSSSDEYLQSKSSLEKRVKGKPPIDLRELKKFLKKSIFKEANSDEEKKKVKKVNDDEDDDDERDSGYDLSEIKNGLTMSETDLLNDQFRTTSAPELSISENNLFTGRSFSRNSLASTNRQLSSEFEESAWGSQELESDHDQDSYQKDKSAGSYEDLDIDLYVVNNIERDENQNFIKTNEMKSKEKNGGRVLKLEPNQIKRLEVRRTGDQVDEFVKKSLNEKNTRDHFNNNKEDYNDNGRDLKSLRSLMYSEEKEERKKTFSKNFKKASLSSSEPPANRWSDPFGHWSPKTKNFKDEKRRTSDLVFGHFEHDSNFSRAKYHTPSVASLRAQYEKEINRWPNSDIQGASFGKIISKRFQELSLNKNMTDPPQNQNNFKSLDVNKKMISKGLQVSSPINNASINTEIDMSMMDNILGKIINKKTYNSIQNEQVTNITKRDIAVGTEKFSRERFSILPDTKSKSTQTDLCQTRSKSIGISTDDTSLENLAIKRQRYRWTREISLYKPTKLVQTDPISKQDVAIDIQKFSDSDRSDETDESETIQIVPLKYSSTESEAYTEPEVDEKKKKLEDQRDEKARVDLEKTEEASKKIEMINHNKPPLMAQSNVTSKKFEQIEDVSRRVNIEKALMNAIMQPDGVDVDEVEVEKNEKDPVEKYEKIQHMENPETEHLITLEKDEEKKKLTDASMLQSFKKDLKTRSTVIVSIHQPNKREISEIDSFTTIDKDGKLSRKTQVTTTKKVPIIQKQQELLDESQPVLISPKATHSSKSEINKAKSNEVEVFNYEESDKTVRPASAIDLLYSKRSPLRPISSLASAFSENEIDIIRETSNMVIKQPVSTSPSSLEKRATSAKSRYTSPNNYAIVDINQSMKKQKIKENEVTWTEASSSTICNEMASDAFKDESGQTHKPKSVLMTSETMIQNKGKESKMETKLKAARRYADESIQEPDITSQAFLSDSPPNVDKKMLPISTKLVKATESKKKLERPIFSPQYSDDQMFDDQPKTSPTLFSVHSTRSTGSPSTYSKKKSLSKSEISSRAGSRTSSWSNFEKNNFSLSRESPTDSRLKTNDLKKYISTPSLETTSSLRQDETAMISRATSEKKLDLKPSLTIEDAESKGTEIVTRIIKKTQPEEFEKDESGKMRKKKNSQSKMILEQELQSEDGIKNKDGCKISSSIILESPLKSKSLSVSRLDNKELTFKEMKNNDDDEPKNLLKSSSSYDSLIEPSSSRHIYTNPNGEVVTTTKFERYKPQNFGKERGREKTIWEYSMECKCINGLNTSVRTSVSHKRTYVPFSLTLYESSV